MDKDREPQPDPITIEDVATYAKETILREGYLVPKVVVVGSRSEAAVTITNFGNTAEEHYYQMIYAGYGLAQRNEVGQPRQVFFVREGVMNLGTTDEAPPDPSPIPMRLQIVVITSFDVLTQHHASLLLDVRRDTEGKISAFVEMPRNVLEKDSQLVAFVDAYTVGSGGTTE
jgi:hypothetical protein